MFGAVKITLVICLTILVSCVLFISYNEYTNRYNLVTTNDNGVYIFDKKNTVLNKCDANGCQVIETKLPNNSILSTVSSFGSSKMFDSEKPMAEETLSKVEAVESQEARNNLPAQNNYNSQAAPEVARNNNSLGQQQPAVAARGSNVANRNVLSQTAPATNNARGIPAPASRGGNQPNEFVE
jgi:hypothetical protein